MALGKVRFMVDGELLAEAELEYSSTVVGRGQESGVVLNHISVARRHARLTIDSGRLFIEDLGSASGTFVDGTRLTPNTSRLLESTSDVRLGDLSFSYEPPPEIAVFSSEPTVYDAPQPASTLVHVELSALEQPIPAGESASIIATLENRTRVVDDYELSVKGVPDSWVLLRTTHVKLLPGQEMQVPIVIRPPRSSDAPAGEYNLALSVTSEESAQVVQANAQFSITPFEETTLEMLPRRGKKSFRVSAKNKGNVAVSYFLSGTDDEEGYSYDFAQPDLSLEPGESAEIPVTVRRRTRKWFGRPELVMFRAKVTPTGSTKATPEAATGQLDFRPPLERLKRPVGLALVLAVLAAAFLLYRASQDDAPAVVDLPDTPTAEPSATAEVTVEETTAVLDESEIVHLCAAEASSRPVAYSGQQPLPGNQAFVGFAQNDARWGPNEYASAETAPLRDIGCGTSLAACGCALSSLATVAALFDVVVMPGGGELNPKTMNEWFREGAALVSGGWVSRGYVFGNVQWELIDTLSATVHAEDPSVPRLHFVGRGSGSEQEIRNELAAGNPVILNVPGHFIVATGIVGNTIQIHDPYYADRTTLDAYAGKVLGSRLVKRIDDDESSRTVVITVPNTFRVRVHETGNDGNAIGTLEDVPLESLQNEIEDTLPGATLETEDAWRDPTCESKAPKPGQGIIRIRLPGDRNYELEIVDPEGNATPSWAVHQYNDAGDLVNVLAGETTTASIPAVPDSSPTPETDGSPTVTETVPATEAATSTAAVAPTASETPTPTATSTPTLTPTPTMTATPTQTPTVTPTPTPMVTLVIQPVDGGTYACNERVTVRWTRTSSVTGSYTLTIRGPGEVVRYEESNPFLANSFGGSVLLDLVQLGMVGTWSANITTTGGLFAFASFRVEAPCPVL